MQWPILAGKVREQPRNGKWHEWKQTIADQCDGRCVYCAVTEARFGGIRNFHVEHFRPKVKFPALENDIGNLYVACAICNVLKSDDWPAEPLHDHSVAAYPDPSVADYNAFLVVAPDTHQVDSVALAGKYLIERVLLNRGQLVIERRLAQMLASLAAFDNWLNGSLAAFTKAEMKAIIQILRSIDHAKTAVLAARPYRDADTKRFRTAKAKSKRSRS